VRRTRDRREIAIPETFVLDAFGVARRSIWLGKGELQRRSSADAALAFSRAGLKIFVGVGRGNVPAGRFQVLEFGVLR
jgi:hypothetical protein